MKIQDFFKKWISTKPNLKVSFHDAGIEAMAFAEAYHKEQLILHGVSKPLNEYNPLHLKKGQKVVVTKNKTSHCYKVGDVLRIIKPHYRNKDAWYCKKGWFGIRQVLTDQEFYVC